MKPNILVRVFTYRHRYWFGHIIFLALLTGALMISFIIPGELTNAEQRSAVKSATIPLTDPRAKDIIDLPYHLLQKLSLHFFGISHLAIKLPSLVIGTFIGLGIVWLLRRWLLRGSIALFASLIAISSSQFLAAASSGTELIMPMFWMVTLFLIGLKVTSKPRSWFWWLACFVAGALSLYTPLSLYFMVCILLVSVLHPHLRYILRTAPRAPMLSGLLLGVIILVPLFIALYKQPSHLMTLVGWPDGGINFGVLKFNLIELGKSYFGFWQPGLGPLGATPVFGFASLALIVFGGIKLTVDHHAARSYGLALLVPFLAAPVLLQPKYALILFIPFIILLAIGIEGLLDEWYKLFPHNPYARVVALVPVALLLGSIILTNISYHADTYRYSPQLAGYYTRDLEILRTVLDRYPDGTIIGTPNNIAFYDLLRRDYPNMSTTLNIKDASTQKPRIISTGTGIETSKLEKISYIATDEYSERAPRFYVFTSR